MICSLLVNFTKKSWVESSDYLFIISEKWKMWSTSSFEWWASLPTRCKKVTTTKKGEENIFSRQPHYKIRAKRIVRKWRQFLSKIQNLTLRNINVKDNDWTHHYTQCSMSPVTLMILLFFQNWKSTSKTQTLAASQIFSCKLIFGHLEVCFLNA